MPVNLPISNIDSKRMMITIEWAKGKKGRLVPLPKILLTGPRKYFREYKPKLYLFEEQEGLHFQGCKTCGF
jgi:integrase/recombinase XerD